jgi:hypothetical protein
MTKWVRSIECTEENKYKYKILIEDCERKIPLGSPRLRCEVIICECAALAVLRFCHLGKHLKEPSYYDEIRPCNILYLFRHKGLLAE